MAFNNVSELKVLELVHSLLAIWEHCVVVSVGICVVPATHNTLVSRLLPSSPPPLRRRSKVGYRKVILAIIPEWGLPSSFLHGCWQGVGRRPAREGRAGQAGTAGSRPLPFSLLWPGHHLLKSPCWRQACPCGRCKDSPFPHTALATDQHQAGLPCRVSLHPRARGQGLPFRIRRKFIPTHPQVSLGLLVLSPGTSPSYK